jgi:hypothetical protein
MSEPLAIDLQDVTLQLIISVFSYMEIEPIYRAFCH